MVGKAIEGVIDGFLDDNMPKLGSEVKLRNAAMHWCLSYFC